jgi:uncharacterized damage-inducible protein DinB
MDELALLRMWYRYNSDVRRRYLTAIARLPARVRRRDEGASYPLLEIFVHVLDAYRWWFRYVYRDRVRAYPAGRLRTSVRSIAAVRRANQATTREVERFVGRLRPRDLQRVVRFRAPADDGWTSWRVEEVTVRAMVWHMVEEELQHRGEMNALLWRHGVEPPIVPWTEWSGGWRVADGRGDRSRA